MHYYFWFHKDFVLFSYDFWPPPDTSVNFLQCFYLNKTKLYRLKQKVPEYNHCDYKLTIGIWKISIAKFSKNHTIIPPFKDNQPSSGKYSYRLVFMHISILITSYSFKGFFNVCSPFNQHFFIIYCEHTVKSINILHHFIGCSFFYYIFVP